MASLSPPFLPISAVFLALSLSLLLISPARSQNCSSKLTSNKIFANCSALPSLNSVLHYTYNATNSSLSVAFIAAPSKPDGWIAWGINPNATRMLGTQAIVAFKSGSGVVSKTYNVASYENVTEGKLSFDVWDLSAESDSAGNFVIFASVKVPAESLNLVWQVGPSVTDGKLAKHDLEPANRQATSTLSLTGTSNTTTTNTNSTVTGDNSTGSAYRVSGSIMGFYCGVSIVLASLIGL